MFVFTSFRLLRYVKLLSLDCINFYKNARRFYNKFNGANHANDDIAPR